MKKYLYKHIKVLYTGLYSYTAYYINPAKNLHFEICGGTTKKTALEVAKDNINYLNNKRG